MGVGCASEKVTLELVAAVRREAALRIDGAPKAVLLAFGTKIF